MIFSSLLQENDFSYLINHFDIDGLTNRAYESYSSIEALYSPGGLGLSGEQVQPWKWRNGEYCRNTLPPYIKL